MIEERSLAVAKCDACGHRDVANDDGSFFGCDGYTLAITQHSNETRHHAYACKETHIGKAARAVLHQPGWQWDGRAGKIVADAPPLPAAPDQVEEAQ